MIALTVVSAVACAVLVAAEWRGLRGLRIAAKLIASAAFIGVGVLALGARGGEATGFADAIVAGLVLGAIGDACLLVHGSRAFLAGLSAFLVGHVAYVVGIAALVPPGRWAGDAGALAVLPIAASAVVLAALWRRLGAMRWPVIGYVVTIAAMVVAAIAAARGHALPEPGRSRLLLGACAFYASDISVARDRFVAAQLANKVWGLPAYYIGQLLFAWSIAA